MELDGLLFDTEQAADAGANDGANAVGVGIGDLQARIMQGHEGGTEAVMDERVHLLGILAADPVLAEQFVVGGDVKAFDLTCDLGGEPFQVGIRNVGQRTDARTTVGDAFPAAGQIIAQRRDHTQAGYDDATLHC
ncbi:hypothetical protein D3C73_860630 [compost metagenome]